MEKFFAARTTLSLSYLFAPSCFSASHDTRHSSDAWKEVIALFGPTNAKRYGPWRQLHNVLEAPDSDLKKLSVENVIDFLKQKLTNY